MLRETIGVSDEFADRAISFSIHPVLTHSVVTLSLYRRLNGAILRNAQALAPVSDLHQLLNSLSPDECDLLSTLSISPHNLLTW